MKLTLLVVGILFTFNVSADSRFGKYSSQTLCNNQSVLSNSQEALKEELDRRDIHCGSNGEILPGKGPPLPEPEPFVRPVFDEAFEPGQLLQYSDSRLCDVKYTHNVQAELKRRHLECVPMIEGRRGGPYSTIPLSSSEENPSPIHAPDQFDTDVLCKWHRNNSGTESIIDTLRSRGDFNRIEMDLIAEEKVAIGMSEEALRCSWGKPTDVNRTVGSWGVHKQFVYSGIYVYTENGRVTSWQD